MAFGDASRVGERKDLHRVQDLELLAQFSSLLSLVTAQVTCTYFGKFNRM